MSQKTSILNSELAVQVLSAVASRREGDYSTNMADELNKSQPSISRILSKLHGKGFIQKGKREKAQYYTVDYDKISEYWYNQVKERLIENNDENTLNRLEENQEKSQKVAAKFFEKVLKNYDTSNNLNVSQMLFSGFVYAIGYNLFDDKNFIEENEFLKPTAKSLKFYLEEIGFCAEMCDALKESIEETK